MKVVVVIKKGLGGNGISQAARYISTRARDEEKEGHAARHLFSETEEQLTYAEANHLLGDGREPRTNDIIHLVISFHQEEDFRQLGTSEAARLKGVRETTRITLREMMNPLRAQALRWVAGVHRNTDNPHVHLLIHRDYVDRETGRTKHLHTLPKEMRVSWEKAADGSRIIKPGLLSQTFEKHCEQNIRQHNEEQQRQHQEVMRERVKLGQAMRAESHLQQLQQSLHAAINWGEWRRCQVVDEQGRSRMLSEFDLQQRVNAVGRQLVTIENLSLPAARRISLQHDVTKQEAQKYTSVSERIRQIRAADCSIIERKLERSLAASKPILQAASMIRSKYESARLQIPVPILSRADLAQLQQRAIIQNDAKKLQYLEAIREALAAEKAEPVRTETEVARLQAQLFVARSSLTVEQQTAARLEETKHLRQWKIGSREQASNYSFAKIETALAHTSDQAKFIGARRLHWDANKRAEARAKTEELTHHRAAILRKIADERATLAAEITRRSELVKVLSEIYAGAQKAYQQEGRKLPTPLVTPQDLRELDAHATRRHEPQFYQTLVRLERGFAAQRQGISEASVADQYGRAIAREVIAKIDMRESAARLERFEAQREKAMVIVKEDGADIRLARLADVTPKSPLASLFQPFLMRSEKYRTIAQAVSLYGERLREQHAQKEAVHTILSGATQVYAQEFVRLNPVQSLPSPAFTARELQRLELQVIKERDPMLRDSYSKLYNEAVENKTPAFSRPIILNQIEAKEIFDVPENAALLRATHQPDDLNFAR